MAELTGLPVAENDDEEGIAVSVGGPVPPAGLVVVVSEEHAASNTPHTMTAPNIRHMDERMTELLPAVCAMLGEGAPWRNSLGRRAGARWFSPRAHLVIENHLVWRGPGSGPVTDWRDGCPDEAGARPWPDPDAGAWARERHQRRADPGRPDRDMRHRLAHRRLERVGAGRGDAAARGRARVRRRGR